jgi:hypothetical protein
VYQLLDEAVSVKQDTVGSASTWFETLTSRCQIKGIAELQSVSALMRLSGDAHCASIGFSHTNAKFVLKQQPDVQGNMRLQMEILLLLHVLNILRFNSLVILVTATGVSSNEPWS